MKILVTGAAGFIGSNLSARLLERGHSVVGVDNFAPVYDPARKRRNVEDLVRHPSFRLIEADIRDVAALRGVDEDVEVFVHLAARAGVRHSIEDPLSYSEVNLDGTVNLLELARGRGVRRFVFASSSSVYGSNEKLPFAESDPVEHPISPYAATKRAGELLCHAWHHLHGMSIACLRFFTVYGPRQRPDLAIYGFTNKMLAGQPITLFGDGTSERDYTFIDDIVQGIEGAIAFTEQERVFDIFNLGENQTTPLLRMVKLLSDALGVEPKVEWLGPQPGDVERTCADISKARELLGYAPTTPVEVGIPRFVEWYRANH